MKSIFNSTPRSRRARPQQHEAQSEPQPAFFQPKLTINAPGDKYEQEADAVADKVVSGQGGQAPAVQKQEISAVQRISLATPQEDEKLSTAEGRMEKDKLIQEKPEIQRAAAPKEEEKPVQKMDAPKEEEKPVQKMEAPKEEEKPVQKMDGPKEEEKPVQKMDAPKEDEKPVQKMEAPKEEEKPVQKMDAPKEEDKPVQKMDAPKEEDKQVQKKDAPKEEEDPLQAKSQSGPAQASPNFSSRISARKGQGSALPDNTRTQMEKGIGADFSKVHIHTDSEAAQMNDDIHAQAFTHGNDVYFNSGKYSPESTEGKRLLAHELTHVVQQGGEQVKRKRPLDEEDYMSPNSRGPSGRFPFLTVADYFEGNRTPPDVLSGSHWVAKFPTSQSIDDLSSPFQSNVRNFYNALIAGGANVSISATLRPPERAFLMHYAYRIAKLNFDPQSVPQMAGVNIVWWHGNLEDSKAAAKAMVSAYNIAYQPALQSLHTQGRAIDMTISWSGDLTINNAGGNQVVVKGTPRSGGNTLLHTVGSSYGVHKLASDPPHWSDNGH